MRKTLPELGCSAALLVSLFTIGTALFAGTQEPNREPVPAGGTAETAPVSVLSLDECQRIALQKNRRRPASQFAVAMAEAQHRQALSGYWPQVDLKLGYQRLDQPMNFVFPATSMAIPAQSIGIPGGSAMVTIPANAFAPGFPPSTVQLPVAYPGQTVNTPAQSFVVPEQNVKVVDRNLLSGTTNLTWLVFDGGMRRGLREQSGGLTSMMREEARRTDLEVADGVRRMYWGAVLALQLHQLGKDTLARMESTLSLTGTLYKGGSGKVTRADYLDNDVMVESIRAMVAQLEKNEIMSQAALANTMGLAWNVSVCPSVREIPVAALPADLAELVGTAYRFSPDWARLEAAVRAAEGGVTTAKSGYYPKIAVTGELHRWWNGGYNGGISTDQNRTGWTLGAGLEVPLFNGFLTRNKVNEALARVNQLKQTQFLLREGLGLQIKDLVTGLDAAAKTRQATSRAMKSAQENRDLNTRAYENELVETDKVIRAQLVEALMSAQYYKASYDCAALASELSLVVGSEIRETLGIGR